MCLSCKHRLRETGNSCKTCQIEHAPLRFSLVVRADPLRAAPSLGTHCELISSSRALLFLHLDYALHSFSTLYLNAGVFPLVLTVTVPACDVAGCDGM